MLRKKRGVPALLGAVVLGCLMSAPLWADGSAANEGGAAGEGVPAVWADKELTFVYQGFTTRYSCDGLRDKMRGVLLDLGADKNSLKVTELGCSSPTGRPDPFPGVKAKMRVLQPVGGSAGEQKPIAAHWQAIDLKPRDSFTVDSGECELMEQVHQKVLPLFSVRNVQFSDNCVPHQASPARPVLKLEALKPDAAPHPAAQPQTAR